MSKPRDPLDNLLDRWRDAPDLPESVTPEVWRRISALKKPAEPAGWLERLNIAFARPSFAGAFVAACMLLGLFLAEIRVSRLQTDYSAHLIQSYVRWIDPLLGTADVSPNAPQPQP